VAGLPVHWRSASEGVRSTLTDASGVFQLTGLGSGAGELLLGDPASPVGPAQALELPPGATDLGTLVVPRLGELTLLVLDESGQPVPGAALSGVGAAGGSLATRSGPDGRARVSFLPRGMYRAFALHPELGRGNTVFEFEPEEPALIEVRLRRNAPRD
jgi:hypothetical protein